MKSFEHIGRNSFRVKICKDKVCEASRRLKSRRLKSRGIESINCQSPNHVASCLSIFEIIEHQLMGYRGIVTLLIQHQADQGPRDQNQLRTANIENSCNLYQPFCNSATSNLTINPPHHQPLQHQTSSNLQPQSP